MSKVSMRRFQTKMIPVIDLTAQDALDRIDEAYTSVGFAVFTNALDYEDQAAMYTWFDTTKNFFDLSLTEKKKLAYQSENNLAYSIMGAEHVDPKAPSDIKESYNYFGVAYLKIKKGLKFVRNWLDN